MTEYQKKELLYKHYQLSKIRKGNSSNCQSFDEFSKSGKCEWMLEAWKEVAEIEYWKGYHDGEEY